MQSQHPKIDLKKFVRSFLFAALIMLLMNNVGSVFIGMHYKTFYRIFIKSI